MIRQQQRLKVYVPKILFIFFLFKKHLSKQEVYHADNL